MRRSRSIATTRSTGWVLIVGASSGIGRAMARQWAEAGGNVLHAGRDLEDLNRSADDLRVRYGVRAQVVAFDATDAAGYERFWRECVAVAGGELAGVVLSHGMLPVQAEAQGSIELTRRAIETNFTSAAALLTPAANDFESRRSGFLCVIASVAGDRGRQSNYVYGSAKAGLDVFLQGLRNRLFRSNVQVVTIKPGFVDTAMTWGLPGMFLVASPESVAADAWRAVRKGRSEIYTPWFWRYIMLIIRAVPEFVFKRLRL